MSSGVSVRVGLLVVLAISAVRGQLSSSEISEWLPTDSGDRWVYEIQARSVDRRNPKIERTQQTYELTVKFSDQRQNGFVRTNGGRDAPFYVRGGSVYSLDILGPERPPDLPDVCFPLHEGQTWGDPAKLREHWTVAGHGKKNADDPASIESSDWRIEAHLASGDDNYVWFRKGVGIVAERTWHDGTYDDRTARLISFSKK